MFGKNKVMLVVELLLLKLPMIAANLVMKYDLLLFNLSEHQFIRYKTRDQAEWNIIVIYGLCFRDNSFLSFTLAMLALKASISHASVCLMSLILTPQ